ncbi:hypothetical protein LUZ60_001319 [Juncus effusus]|nr:hypothetical protein LUZ60_001319 [Juncus effusus]
MGPFSACFLFFILLSASSSEGGTIGVNYGRVANNLPTAANVVQLLKSNGIAQVKLYDTDSTVLRSFAGSGIKVTVALPNELLYSTAKSSSFAFSWVQRNVAIYCPATQIQAIAVGNEVFVAKNLTNYLLPAMTNVQAALVKLKLDKSVKVSSPMALTALQNSYPPSAGVFRPDLAEPVIKPILELLRQTGSYLMINAYPFFAYEANSNDISLDYALFRPNEGNLDGGSGLKYYSLLDAQIDAVVSAMSALKYDDVKIVVSETGWPSKGDSNEIGANAQNAAAYNGNLIRRVLSGNSGTPKRPAGDMDVYLFGLFNENQKPGPTSERNYGLFFPNERKVYDIDFVLGNSHTNNPKGNMSSWEEDRPKGNKNNNNNNNNNNNGAGAPGSVRESSTGETWCVANGALGKERLQQALDYACGEGGADCKAIQPGAACFEPNTIEAHASYAFNSYYQKKGRSMGTCFFSGAGYVVSQTPKIGNCELPTRV